MFLIEIQKHSNNEKYILVLFPHHILFLSQRQLPMKHFATLENVLIKEKDEFREEMLMALSPEKNYEKQDDFIVMHPFFIAAHNSPETDPFSLL